MTQPNSGEKIPLTVYLSPDVAKRLKAAAEAQKRPAADLAADLLDRYLPRPPPPGNKRAASRTRSVWCGLSLPIRRDAD